MSLKILRTESVGLKCRPTVLSNAHCSVLLKKRLVFVVENMVDSKTTLLGFEHEKIVTKKAHATVSRIAWKAFKIFQLSNKFPNSNQYL